MQRQQHRSRTLSTFESSSLRLALKPCQVNARVLPGSDSVVLLRIGIHLALPARAARRGRWLGRLGFLGRHPGCGKRGILNRIDAISVHVNRWQARVPWMPDVS